MKNIAVLGCTGSIGRQTLDVIRANPDKFRAAVLCAGRDADAMFKAAEEFRPDYIAMADEAAADKLRQSGIKAKIAGGEQAVLEAAASVVWLVLFALLFAGGNLRFAPAVARALKG